MSNDEEMLVVYRLGRIIQLRLTCLGCQDLVELSTGTNNVI